MVVVQDVCACVAGTATVLGWLWACSCVAEMPAGPGSGQCTYWPPDQLQGRAPHLPHQVRPGCVHGVFVWVQPHSRWLRVLVRYMSAICNVDATGQWSVGSIGRCCTGRVCSCDLGCSRR
jgi:hypothetical protein